MPSSYSELIDLWDLIWEATILSPENLEQYPLYVIAPFFLFWP